MEGEDGGLSVPEPDSEDGVAADREGILGATKDSGNGGCDWGTEGEDGEVVNAFSPKSTPALEFF